jgi:Tol biopolymer transport system component
MLKALLAAFALAATAISATASRPALWTSCGRSGDLAPAWSPNGRAVAFTHVHSSGAVSQVFRIGRDGHGLKRISSRVTEFAYDPVWSPDGASLAYTSFDDAAVVRIVVARADGARAHVVAAFQGERNPPTTFVTWSPDGSQLAYVDFAGELVSVETSGGGAPHVLAHGATQPAWSPSGGRIAYVGLSGIVVASADGASPHTIADGAYPRWSPDGRSLAYTSRSGVGVHVISSDGGDDRLVDASGTIASWFRDGRRLVDATAADGARHSVIHVVDVVYRRPVTVSNDSSRLLGSDDAAPIVAPNGRDILFVSARSLGDYDSELRLVEANGRRERRLTYHCVVVDGGSGSRVYGTSLDDVILARNLLDDTILCGPGRDRVIADPRDRVSAACETVRR